MACIYNPGTAQAEKGKSRGFRDQPRLAGELELVRDLVSKEKWARPEELYLGLSPNLHIHMLTIHMCVQMHIHKHTLIHRYIETGSKRGREGE